MINILDKQTIDKIAAGEVVERPANVVKELCENSIDAGADAISIEISDGGIKLIRITDNGRGIEADDVKTAFLRHATSKINDIKDLDFINTLGFRGEALSSIAAVSKLEICTKTKEAMTGVIYKISGGEDVSFEEAGLPDGTTIIVRDIFYNTPARLKFLKSPGAETSYITDVIERLALSHPEVAFKFISNNSIKLSTNGSCNLKDVIYAIYGREITGKLLEVEGNSGLLSIKGFIASPDVARGNRAYENYFINGRYVKDKIIESAIEEAYKGYQMKGTFPFTAFDIKIEPELVDVNVHPAKMEIRFYDNKNVFDAVSSILSEKISGRQNIPVASLDKKNDGIKNEIPKETGKYIPEPFETKRMMQEKIYDASTEDEQDDKTKHAYDVQEYNSIKDEPDEDVIINEENNYGQTDLFNDDFLSEKAKLKHRIIGDAFDTYWIVEYDGQIYIIDQHAAHEKVLYEKYKKNLKEKAVYSQNIMPPLLVELKPSQEEAYLKCMEQFNDMGFIIEPFGEKDYQICAVPMDLYGLNDKDNFLIMLDELSQIKGSPEPEILLDKIATAACKAAVKGGGRLSFDEADHLIEDLLGLENPYNCPHGRPTIITITKRELERKFKRLV